MANLNDILSNLNSGYEEITNLIPDMRVFVDDYSDAKNEYGVQIDKSPLGGKIIALSSGKYLWVGIDGASESCRNVRRYNSDFTLDETFSSPVFQSGNNGFVRDVVELSNGKFIIVGHFEVVNETLISKIARLNSDGSLDSTFDVGSGFNNNALVVRLLSDGSLLVGGTFEAYNEVNTGRLVKLNSDGVLDASFATNVNISDNINDIKVDSSGKIYVGGQFTNGIIRLNSDGTTDVAFDVGSGFNSRVASIELNSNGKLIVGGWFNSYKGSPCNLGVVRLETNGDLDSSFVTEGSGLNSPNGSVQCLALQSDGKILAGGWFNQYDGNRQGHIIRFNSNGSKDSSFAIGYGFGDESEWNGQRVQSILLHNNKIICVGSLENYGGKAIYGFAKLSLTGEIDTERLFKYTTFGINDGYDDMYDGGNYINTNLTQLFDDISGDNVDGFLSVPNTHSAALNEADFEDEGEPTYEPAMDGVVKSGDLYFGEGSSYFTNMYPGMYIMVANNINIEEFSIAGDLGSDEDSEKNSTTIVVNNGTYTIFVKVNREGSGGESGSDPSVNHIIIVPGNSNGLTQVINEGQGDDADDHCIRGLTGRKSIAYILVARQTGDYVSYEDAEAIAIKFLQVSGGLSSVQTYSARGNGAYDLSPDFVRQVGEGSLDTAVIEVDGERVSLQRTGYYEVVDSNGNRKVVEVKDGETWDDAPETPEVTDNPNGHPTFGGNDNPVVTEQVIPVGNPLSR